MTRLLFICSRNRLRSPTAEQVFGEVSGIETMSAGVAPDAETPLSADMIEWADLIFVMEATHRSKFTRRFGSQLRDKRIICLDIPDDYEHMDPALIALLWERVPRSVPGLAAHRPG